MENRKFNTGAVRSMDKDSRYDLIPWDAIHELAKHCAKGAKKYGERNAELGIPNSSLVDSAIRHLSCYMRGETGEEHIVNALWNLCYIIYNEHHHPEMNDIPIRMGKKGI